ncbi:aromatic acid exporter family protein [Micromonospora echinospora]|uniref:FUSC family protein n=1 Tax=Micromonospora echinospora TaxID=1877 RepID=UPI00366B56D8
MAVARNRRRALWRRSERLREGLVDVDTARIAGAMAELRHRSRATLSDRLHRLRSVMTLALQAGLAAALSWLAAHELLGNPEPVFAPISAVGTLAASVGQRLRRTVELIVGVALGVLIGDLIIYFLGTGPWQLALVVFLAIVVSTFLGGNASVVIQAAATAVLIATLSPSTENLEIPRFVDAFVGGGIALLVTAVLLPLNPLRVINRAARPALDLLADQLDRASEGIRDRNRDLCQRALERLRANHEELTAFTEAIEGAKETITISPARWHRRDELHHYAEAAEPIDRAMRNSGTLIRRAVTMIEDGEPVPDPLPDAVGHLAESVRLLRHEFAVGAEPQDSRERSLRAVSEAGRAYTQGVGFSGSVVVAQVRTTASDLMVASGLEQGEANRLVREAFGEQETPTPPAERHAPPRHTSPPPLP